MGLRPKPCAKRLSDTHPRKYCSETHQRRAVEFIALGAEVSKRLCHPVQCLRIKRGSFLPHDSPNRRNLPRHCKPCHFPTHAVFGESLQAALPGFGLHAPGRCSDEDILQAAVAVAVQSPRRNGLSATDRTRFKPLVFRTHVRHRCHWAVVPEFTPSAGSMRCVQSHPISAHRIGPSWGMVCSSPVARWVRLSVNIARFACFLNFLRGSSS